MEDEDGEGDESSSSKFRCALPRWERRQHQLEVEEVEAEEDEDVVDEEEEEEDEVEEAEEEAEAEEDEEEVEEELFCRFLAGVAFTRQRGQYGISKYSDTRPRINSTYNQSSILCIQVEAKARRAGRRKVWSNTTRGSKEAKL